MNELQLDEAIAIREQVIFALESELRVKKDDYEELWDEMQRNARLKCDLKRARAAAAKRLEAIKVVQEERDGLRRMLGVHEVIAVKRHQEHWEETIRLDREVQIRGKLVEGLQSEKKILNDELLIQRRKIDKLNADRGFLALATLLWILVSFVQIIGWVVQ